MRQIEKPILNFIGYGELESPYWFIGLEEGFHQGTFSLEDQHVSRLKYSEVMDLEEAMVMTEGWNNLNHKLDNLKTRTWEFIAKLVMTLENKSWYGVENKNRIVKEYILSNIGNRKGNTLLIEILPLPKASKNSWPDFYKKYFLSRKKYESRITKYRIKLLQEKISENKPKYIIGYGKSKWGVYKSLFPNLEFNRFNNLNKKRHFEIAQFSGTKVVLTSFFGNGQFSDDDAFQLGRILLGE